MNERDGWMICGEILFPTRLLTMLYSLIAIRLTLFRNYLQLFFLSKLAATKNPFFSQTVREIHLKRSQGHSRGHDTLHASQLTNGRSSQTCENHENPRPRNTVSRCQLGTFIFLTFRFALGSLADWCQRCCHGALSRQANGSFPGTVARLAGNARVLLTVTCKVVICTLTGRS